MNVSGWHDIKQWMACQVGAARNILHITKDKDCKFLLRGKQELIRSLRCMMKIFIIERRGCFFKPSIHGYVFPGILSQHTQICDYHNKENWCLYSLASFVDLHIFFFINCPSDVKTSKIVELRMFLLMSICIKMVLYLK